MEAIGPVCHPVDHRHDCIIYTIPAIHPSKPVVSCKLVPRSNG